MDETDRPSGEAAPDDRRIVLLRPKIVGDTPDRVRVEITSAVIAGLRRGEAEVIESDQTIDGCADSECRRQVAAELGVTRVLTVTVTVTRRDYDTKITLYDGATGDEVAAIDRRCELCGIAEVAELVDSQSATLLRRIQQKAVAATLVVRSDPPGARVLLDRRPIGTTPLTVEVAVGAHAIELAMRGFTTAQRNFTALAGVRETLMVTLTRPDQTRTGLRRGAIVSFAAAGVVGVVGAALVGIHGRPNRLMCSGGDVDAQGDCRFLYGTRAPGVALIALGSAGLMVGIGLIGAWRSANGRRPKLGFRAPEGLRRLGAATR